MVSRRRVAQDAGNAGVCVLHVEDGVLGRLLGCEIDVDLDRLVVAARDEMPAGCIDADLVDELIQKDDVAAPLRHLRRLAALGQVDELVEQHLQRVARMSEHLGERLQAPHVAVMVCSQDVHEPVEAFRVFPADVGGVGREVRRSPVRAHQHSILLVAVADDRAQSAPSASNVSSSAIASGISAGRRSGARSCRNGCGTDSAWPRSAPACEAPGRRPRAPGLRCTRRDTPRRAAHRPCAPRRRRLGSCRSARRRR